MIQKITIKNFQSHKSTVLEFSEGVNVLIGTSDSGKSAILRAVDLVVNNKPSGDSYRSHWGGDTEVTIEKTDGTTVTRAKTKQNPNLYQVGDLKLTAFKQSVPEEVSRALDIDGVINLQKQFDGPFLISKNAGEVAQHFSKVANLEIIAKTTKKVDGWGRKLAKQIEAEAQTIEKNTNALKQYEHLQKYEMEIEVLEGLDAKRKKMESRIITLAKTIKQLEEVSQQIEADSPILNGEQLVNDLLTFSRQKTALEQQISQLTSITQTIPKYDNEITELSQQTKASKLIDSLLSLIMDGNVATKATQALFELTQTIMATDKAIEDNKNTLSELEELYHDNFPDVCPFCGKN